MEYIYLLFSILFIVICIYLMYYIILIHSIITLIANFDNKKSKIIFFVDGSVRLCKLAKYIFGKYIVHIDDANKFLNILQSCDDDTILHIYIETYGGCVKSNDIIVHNLLNYKCEINTYVNRYAYSAGSLIALCGTNLHMNKYASLGPTDPMTNFRDEYVSIHSLIKLNELKDVDNLASDLLIEVIEGKKLYDENIRTLNKIFAKRQMVPKNKIERLTYLFGSGGVSHTTSFTAEYLKKNGLNILMSNTTNTLSNILLSICHI